MKKYFYYFFFFLLVLNISFGGNYINFYESFLTTGESSYNHPYTVINGSTLSTSKYFYGDIGLWYLGEPNGGTPNPTTAHTFNISNYWLNWDNYQLQIQRNPVVSDDTIFFHIFDNLMVLQPGKTTLSFYHNRTVNDETTITYAFINSTGGCQLYSSSRGDHGGNTWVDICNSFAQVDCTSQAGVTETRTQYKTGFNTSNCNVTEELQFNKFLYMVGSTSGFGYTYYFDDLNINNILNGSNTLPQVNVSIGKTECYNLSTQDLIKVYLNISSYDLEDDTVYYATNSEFTYYKAFFDSTLSTSKCFPYLWDSHIYPICEYTETADIQNFNFINFENNCNVGLDSTDFSIDYWNNYKGDNTYMLHLNPTCSYNKSIYLDLRKPNVYIDNFDYVSTLYWMGFNDNSFNLTFLFNLESNIKNIDLQFIHNSSKQLEIFNINNTGTFRLGSVNITNSKLGLDYWSKFAIKYDYDSNSFNFTLSNSDSNTSFNNIRGIQDESFITNYHKISISANSNNHFVFFEDMVFGSLNYPTWNSELIDILYYDTPGYKTIRYYTTDIYHLGSNIYNTEFLEFNLPICNYGYSGSWDENYNWEKYDVEHGFIFSWFNRYLGYEINNYLIATDVIHIARNSLTLGWIFLLLFISLLLTLFKVLKRFDIEASFFITTIIMNIIVYILGWWEFMFIYGSLFVIITILLMFKLIRGQSK